MLAPPSTWALQVTRNLQPVCDSAARPQELEKLQDQVPAFSSTQALQIIEEGLGAPVTSVFQSVERKPLAAASLGQVLACAALCLPDGDSKAAPQR